MAIGVFGVCVAKWLINTILMTQAFKPYHHGPLQKMDAKNTGQQSSTQQQYKCN